MSRNRQTINKNKVNDELLRWSPRTHLGRDVKSGEINSINFILENCMRILEPEIVDRLIPDLEEEVILIGGTPGKGGGKKRTVVKKTARMHKSGRRMSNKTMVIIGNKNGLIGYGESGARDVKKALAKAKNQAKMNIFRIRRGCGSWECGCTGKHSIPFKSVGKSGSTEVELIPAPRGIGLAVSDEVKKVLSLAGITDAWIRSVKSVKTRENQIKAIINALKNLNRIKTTKNIEEETGLLKGVI